MHRVLSAFFLAGIVWVTGCADDGLPPMGRVRGVASLDGDPLPDSIVTLTPVAGGRPAQGKTDDQGAFDMSTFSLGDGAIAGEHTVVVTPRKSPPVAYLINPKTARGYEPPFPPRYWSSNSSGFTATVEANRSNELNLELTLDP